MEADARLILACGALLVAGLLVWLVADRFRAPSLVLFLVLGMAIGSDGAGWIHFGFRPEDYLLTRLLGTVGLAVILFEAGLASGFREIRPVLGPGIGLAVVGTLVTAGVAGMASVWLFHMPVIEGLLLGSILASTDGAAVFSLLRGLRLRARLARTLEAEAGLNDPVAFLLVVGLIELIQRPGFSAWNLLQVFVAEHAVRAAVGLGVGWLARETLRRLSFAPQGVHLVGPLAALSHLKHGYNWDRSLLDGIGGAQTWCGLGVLANNCVKIAPLMEYKAATPTQSKGLRRAPDQTATGPRRGHRSPSQSAETASPPSRRVRASILRSDGRSRGGGGAGRGMSSPLRSHPCGTAEGFSGRSS